MCAIRILKNWVAFSVIFLIITSQNFAQIPGQIKFEQLTTADGLSNHQIHQTYQDDLGYIWIATLYGLNRFDGQQVKKFFHKVSDTTSLPNNTIVWIGKGPDGNMWVKTSAGIVSYDSYSESFRNVDYYLEMLRTDGVFLLEIVEDKLGNFWFLIENRGVTKISRDQGVIDFGVGPNSDVKIASNNVRDIFLDENGGLWLAHAHGMVEMIDPVEDKVKKQYGIDNQLTASNHEWNIFVDRDMDLWLYVRDKKVGLYYLNTSTGVSKILGDGTLSSDILRSIIQLEGGELWIGTDHGGISILDKATWNIKHLSSDPDIPGSLTSNNVNHLLKDRDEGVWVSTTKSSVSYYVKGSNNFPHFKIDRKFPAFNDMSSFVEDRDGIIWIGTNGKGILSFNKKSHHFESITEKVNGHSPSVIVSLLYDSKGTLWIGTYLEGLYQYDGKRFTKFSFSDRALNDLSIWEIFEDSKGDIWIGTLNNGVFVIDGEGKEKAHYSIDDYLPANYVTCVEEDHFGNIWMGSGTGLVKHNPEKGLFKIYQENDTLVRSPISSNSIIDIKRDSQNRIWVAALDGLNLYRPNSDDFKVLNEKDGLPANMVYAIEEDSDGSLWMSTSKGITKMSMNATELEFQSFTTTDGLQGDNFTEDASFKTTDGHLIFGGQNGMNIFNPADIEYTEHKPQLFFTHLFVNGEKILPGEERGGHVVLQNNLNQSGAIELDYNQNSFKIEFVALSFTQTDRMRYQYKLEGHDNEWRSVATDDRSAAYSNLDYGKYTLNVRASSNSSAWSDEVISVNLVVHPPFWQTGWAYFLYTLVVIGVLYLSRRYIVRRERHKAKVENEMKETERRRQLDMMKIKFFTNISHDFRTPLSLILTPIERMLGKPDNIKVSELELVQRNARRLMTLVNQLLDFRKMEANQHVVQKSSGDVISFLKNITDSFSDLANEKNIDLSFESEKANFFTLFDRDKLEKIMFNLLSNAFKFTLPDGEVRVDFEVLEKKEGVSRVLIIVADTGVGIPEDKRKLVFNRFFQNDTSEEIVNNGTGIGLSITKEFVELHGGNVSVESNMGQGSTFIVELPLKEISSEEEVAEELVKDLTQSQDIEVLPNDSRIDGAPVALLVEDNFDFRFYLSDNLKQYFNIETASNGKEAWKKIKNSPPDIVISDVMMPVMDGVELCEKIKSDPRTSDIPVILLTAKSAVENKVEGLNAGAIEYISKPFNFEVLLSSVQTALKFHDRVKESGKTIEATPSEIEIESQDEILVRKATALVEANMSNSEFSVQDMSHELGYSRGHLYEKILKITHETPIDFIRNIRMKRAADLLERSQLNVSEVAYTVGYNNPKLFSRYFKSKFKIYPSEYRNQFKS